ncbi:hypothetical protein QAD02_019881 [Eretmocerus hayati]|uniref:Uncharacterized protein n=1 Tax=Eretmocerus hayati TaxID=131215 RepID=A0ACC2PLC3_9HYME|nr:hypothetical protein QAD02_019881 [Eretmocerus hayati]
MSSTSRDGSRSPDLPDDEQQISMVQPASSPNLGDQGSIEDCEKTEAEDKKIDESPLSRFKWVLVQFTDANRGKDHLRVSVDDLHGFYDDISTKEPIFLRNVVVDSTIVKEGWVRVLFKSETLEGLDTHKRVPVEKMNDSSIELAIKKQKQMIDPKDIKKERVETMKNEKTQKKKVSQPKKSKKSSEPSMNAAATAQLKNGLLGAATKPQDRDLLERIRQLEEMNSELCKKVQGASCASTKTSTAVSRQHSQDAPSKSTKISTPVARQVSQDALSTCTKASTLVDRQLSQYAPPTNTKTSTPVVREHSSKEDLVSSISPIVPSTHLSAQPSSRRSLFPIQSEDSSSSSSDSASPPAPVAQNGPTNMEAPAMQMVTAKRTCARAPARRRSSTSSSPSSKKRKEETKLDIPKYCDKNLYETPMALLQEVEFEIDGKKVIFLHLYYGIMIQTENWCAIQKYCVTIFDYMIGLCRNIWGKKLQNKAYRLIGSKPRIPGQVREEFTPRKLTCAWRVMQYRLHSRHPDQVNALQNEFGLAMTRVVNNEINGVLRTMKK